MDLERGPRRGAMPTAPLLDEASQTPQYPSPCAWPTGGQPSVLSPLSPPCPLHTQQVPLHAHSQSRCVTAASRPCQPGPRSSSTGRVHLGRARSRRSAPRRRPEVPACPGRQKPSLRGFLRLGLINKQQCPGASPSARWRTAHLDKRLPVGGSLLLTRPQETPPLAERRSRTDVVGSHFQ